MNRLQRAMVEPDRARAFDHMLLITYSVRTGSVEQGYEDWLRRIDNPFFNAAPSFAHYGNWKESGGTNHFAPHVYFDFVGMIDRDSFDAVWNGAEVNEFRREWRRLWGMQANEPGAALQTCRCERTVRSDGAWSAHLALLPGAGDPSSGWETWETRETLRGTPLSFDRFSIRYGSGDATSERTGAAAQGVLLAECIAAPELGRR